jgi:DNA repair protein RadC
MPAESPSGLARGDAPRRRASGRPVADRPRERLRRHGAEALATAELLALILGTGTKGASAVEVGHRVLARFGITGLRRASADELCVVPGCGPVKAVRVQAAVELGRRLATPVMDAGMQVSGPGEAAEILMAEMQALEQEHLRVVLLNTKNRVLGVHEVYKGSVSSSPVRSAEVYREAVRRNAPAIIVAHNHPSGDPTPSPQDTHVTRQLVEAGRVLDVELLDHLVIGDGRWVSMRERGLGFA